MPHRSASQSSANQAIWEVITAQGKNIPRKCLIVGCSVKIDITECLRHRRPQLRVVAQRDDFRGVDVHVERAVEVEVEDDVGGEVELRVESAGAVAGEDGGNGGELVHVGRAGGGAVEALLDAVADALDEGEGEVDFGDDARHVESTRVWRCGVSWEKWRRSFTMEMGCGLQRMQPWSWVLRPRQMGSRPWPKPDGVPVGVVGLKVWLGTPTGGPLGGPFGDPQAWRAWRGPARAPAARDKATRALEKCI